MKLSTSIIPLFQPDHVHYDGVPRIKIYLLRLVFFLTFIFVGTSSWSSLITHTGTWKPLDAVAFSVWAAYATLSLLGLFHTLKMLPLVLFQIFYKVVWLIVVAYPMWSANELAGSEAADLTSAFLWVILPIVAMPWSYLFRNYFLVGKRSGKTGAYSSSTEIIPPAVRN